MALGDDGWAARFVEKIVDRVYRENDRRTQAPDERPTPGGAREYWPEPLGKFTGNDAYGWGAETLPLLLRHIVGFREDDAGWHGVSFTLVPGLPDGWHGTYTLANIQYRAVALDLTYTITDDDTMTAQIVSRPSLPCHITSADGAVLLNKGDTAARCYWQMKIGAMLSLVQPSGQRSGEDGATNPLNK
ncbi:MAG: hypothetical protein ACR2M3_03485, partial [Thermomicrobiales bacterium]